MGGRQNTTKRMKQRNNTSSKKISVRAFETIDIIKLLYKFDSVASRAAQRAGITIPDEKISELGKRRVAIEAAFEEFIGYGQGLNIFKNSERYKVLAEKDIVTNALATSMLISKLYVFDRVAVCARQSLGFKITSSDFEELDKKRKAIEAAFEEYINMGVAMKLIKTKVTEK